MGKLGREFKEFIAGGNMIELAVAFIMGGLFGRVIAAFVDNIVMPIIAAIFGQPNFDEALKFKLRGGDAGCTKDAIAAGQACKLPTYLSLGSFLTVALAVVLTALAVFLFVVKPYNRMKKSAEPAAAGPSEADLLGEIRDLLARR